MLGALAVAALVLSFAPPPHHRSVLDARPARRARARLGRSGSRGRPCATTRCPRSPSCSRRSAWRSSRGSIRRWRRSSSRWLLFSLALCIAAVPVFTHFRRFAAYKYLWVIASLVLFGLLLAFGRRGQRRAALDPPRSDPVRADRAHQAVHRVLPGRVSGRDGRRDRQRAAVVPAREPEVPRPALHRLGRVDRDPDRAARPRHGHAAARDVRDAALRRDAPRRHRGVRRACCSRWARFGRRITIRTCSPDRGVAQPVLRPARRRLSVVAGLLLAGRGRIVRARVTGWAIPTSSPTSRPTTCTRRSPKSSA